MVVVIGKDGRGPWLVMDISNLGIPDLYLEDSPWWNDLSHKLCANEAPRGISTCDRAAGHTGRHHAGAGGRINYVWGWK